MEKNFIVKSIIAFALALDFMATVTIFAVLNLRMEVAFSVAALTTLLSFVIIKKRVYTLQNNFMETI